MSISIEGIRPALLTDKAFKLLNEVAGMLVPTQERGNEHEII